jgi:uncharacterized protein (TIGR02271 family)
MKSEDPGTPGVPSEEIVIPVAAEELTVETRGVVRARVQVTKRIEARDAVVEVPLIHEALVIERVPVNAFVEAVAPVIRHEDGVLVIPLMEEVTVPEKRLLLREEIRVSRHRSTTTRRQTVALRREVVDVTRDEPDTRQPAHVGVEISTRKEQTS